MAGATLNNLSPNECPMLDYIFMWLGPPFPLLLHCLVILLALAWEYVLDGNQCDNAQSCEGTPSIKVAGHIPAQISDVPSWDAGINFFI
jgi:hypothetical protein